LLTVINVGDDHHAEEADNAEDPEAEDHVQE
jgi:hypothetical protein